jgi:hypothetical protein
MRRHLAFILGLCLAGMLVMPHGAAAQAKPLAAAQTKQAQPRPPVDAATRAMRREAEAKRLEQERVFVKLRALPRGPEPALDVNLGLARQQAEAALVLRRARLLQGRVAMHNDGIVIWMDVIALKGEEPPSGQDEAEEGEDDDENQPVPPDRRKIIVASESFDQCLFNGLTIDESRQRLKENLESRIDRIDAVNRLSPEQKQKLRLAGKGDIKHLFDQIEAKRQQFEQVRADLDECRTLLHELAPLREAYVNGPFREGSLFIKTLWKIRRANEPIARPPSR